MAESSLQLRPFPHIRIEVITGSAPDLERALDRVMWRDSEADSVATVEYPGRNATVELYGVGSTIKRGAETEIRINGMPSRGSASFATGEDVVCVQFQLLNFVDFTSWEGSPQSQGPHFRHSQELRLGDWRVVVSRHDKSDAYIQELKRSGGYAITHTGNLDRADGNTFSVAEAQQILFALHYFFSFARGAWSGPSLGKGLDARGEQVWESWYVTNVSGWTARRSWFHPDRGETLAEAVSGFWKLWQDAEWRETLHRAIYWYVAAGSEKGVEASIVLIQAALELLAWQHLVLSPKPQLTAKQYENLRAFRVFPQLLGDLDVPTSIPGEATELAAFASLLGNLDGPVAFTRLRNSLVHPRPRQHVSTAPVEVKLEARNLGLWYIEMVMLRLFGFAGMYNYRFAEGPYWSDAVPVPWARP